VLVGLMGTGKSSAGKRVARWLGRRYLDNDAELEARTGKTAKQIAETDGEDALHALELTLLRDAVASPEPLVIGAAASVVDTASGRAELDAPTVVWLRADPERLGARLAQKHNDRRPLGDDPAATIVRQAAVRYPLFAEVADMTVDADGNHTSLAEEIVTSLRSR
jgi:shikimate kinase